MTDPRPVSQDNNNNNNNGYPKDQSRRRYFYGGQYYAYGQGPQAQAAYYLAPVSLHHCLPEHDRADKPCV